MVRLADYTDPPESLGNMPDGIARHASELTVLDRFIHESPRLGQSPDRVNLSPLGVLPSPGGSIACGRADVLLNVLALIGCQLRRKSCGEGWRGIRQAADMSLDDVAVRFSVGPLRHPVGAVEARRAASSFYVHCVVVR